MRSIFLLPLFLMTAVQAQLAPPPACPGCMNQAAQNDLQRQYENQQLARVANAIANLEYSIETQRRAELRDRQQQERADRQLMEQQRWAEIGRQIGSAPAGQKPALIDREASKELDQMIDSDPEVLKDMELLVSYGVHGLQSHELINLLKVMQRGRGAE